MQVIHMWGLDIFLQLVHRSIGGGFINLQLVYMCGFYNFVTSPSVGLDITATAPSVGLYSSTTGP